MEHKPQGSGPDRVANGRDRFRILFYLPTVTPWWFENICAPLIGKCAERHEVHVMVCPLWRGTGIAEGQFPVLEALPQVRWHVLDGPGHPDLRIDGSEAADLFELVDFLAPDLTLCRSADLAAPARFPGAVRFIMEGAAPPLQDRPTAIVLARTLFDYGLLPVLPDDQAARLDALAPDLWRARALRDAPSSREAFFLEHDLPARGTLIGLPLEYEQEENFFDRHHRYAGNAEMIADLAGQMPGGAILAATHHPLTERHGDPGPVEEIVATLGDRVRLLPSGKEPGAITRALACHCDAMIIGNSKSWSAAAAAGKPIVRLSEFATGDWIGAYDSLPAFRADHAAGTVRSPDPAMARRWFSFHMLNDVFDPAEPSLTGDEIVARALERVDPGRWDRALERCEALSPGQAA